MLKAVPGIPANEAHLRAPSSKYIAVASAKRHVPPLPWTIFEAVEDAGVSDDFVHVGASFSDMPVRTRPIEPITIKHIVLTAPKHVYETLKTRDVLPRLQGLVRAGSFVESLQCRIKACEPVDQGLVDSKTSVSVLCEGPSEASPRDLEISAFLGETETLHKQVRPLKVPIPAASIQPVPLATEDLENAVYMRIDQVARLGVFSGDLVTIKAESARVVRLYAYPEPNTIDEELYMPPMLWYNLGSPSQVEVLPDSTPLPVAKDVTISRVASAISTDRTYQQAFLSGLRSYFEQCHRVVQNGDTICVSIDTLLAATVQDEDLSVQGTPDALVWFKVSGLEAESQFIVNSSQTRMVQSGYAAERCPVLEREYYGLKSLPSYGEGEFKYMAKIRKLLRAALATGATPGTGPPSGSLTTTILMTSSKRGAGKTTALRVAAAELGIHEFIIDCYEVVGDSDAKTVGTLKAKLERAASIEPCLVILRHADAIARKSEQDGRDPVIVASVAEVLSGFKGILAATTSDADKLTESVRNKFKFEVDVTVPTEAERRCILQHLTRDIPSVSLVADEALSGYALRGDISLDALAMQSAGLTPPDLKSIVRVARAQAQTGDTTSIISQRGTVKITAKDIEAAVSSARSKYSDSIGAPKIPNVGWKDVGGLDGVKGEIMDTIEMPLKFPHLFASGVKKRSGILFYGPPGTGKTLMAKAIATSFSLNFFSVKGPELLNMYIGESEANVRRVFQKARDAKPCVVFFDELDSVAPKRGNQGDSGGVMDRIVSQLLAELDGMSEGADGVFVIGATNRPDLLDEALLRPGRFDKLLYLGVSDTHEKQRTIIEALTRKFDLDPRVDLAAVAAKCPFTFTGADFYAMSSDAMLNAMTRTAGEVDEKIRKYNEGRETPIAIRSWFEHVATEQDTHVLVQEADFAKAQAELVPSVSAEELAHYQRIRDSFEGGKVKS